jgi:two-component system cell cycle response regulator
MAHILFVDADPFFVKLYVDILGGAGHRTSRVTKLAEFDQLKDEPFDLAFVELGFAFEHGLRIVETLRKKAKPPEIVGVLKPGEATLLASGFKQGVVDVMTKPIEGNHLLALTNRLLERQKLHQEAMRLRTENQAQASLNKVFTDGLQLLKTLDDGSLHEKLLRAASVLTDCQGIALYVARRTHLELAGYFGVIQGEKLPPSLALSAFDLVRSDVTPNVYAVDDPLAIERGEAPRPVAPGDGKGLVFVLAQDHMAEGILVASARLGHPFSAVDMVRAQLLADVASVGFSNARKFTAERKKAVQTRHSNTYNMSFFVDFLGKELHKSRRYRRSFSIVQIVFDNYPGLAAELGPRGTERLANDIPRVLQDVLRDSDVLARASDNEYLLVLPESDIYGARMTMSRIEAALMRDSALNTLQKNLSLGTAISYSSFPQDGNDIDSLMAATRRRLDEMRRSAYRKLHFEDSSFYDAASLLLTKASPMRRFIDSPVEYGYTQMTPVEVSAWVRELLRSTQSLQKSHSVLYWGVPEISIDILASIADVLEVPPPGAPNRLFVLGARDPSIKDVPPGITTVYLDPEKATKMGFLFSLSETHAYAMIGENLSVAEGEAFHTCDTHLALGLVRKLQAEFNLQRWF